MSAPQHMPTTIGFCITDLDPGGAEKALVQLVLGLDRRYWDPFVVCLSGRGALADELEQGGVETRCLQAVGLRSVTRFWALVREFRRRRPQLVQTYLFHANLVGRLAAAVAGVPRVVSGIRVAEQRYVSRLWWDRWTQRLVDRHVAVSQAAARFSVDTGRLQPDRVVVIPNGVDTQRLAAVAPRSPVSWGLPAEARMILFAGRLDDQKDPLLLLEAVQEVLDHLPDVHLVMAGSGPLHEVLQQRIASAPTRPRMHLLGQRSDVPALLRSASCFVLPSRWEGMPNAVLEAMAAGCPVVATRVEGSTEILDHDRCGLLVPVGDAAALSAAITRVLTDPPLVDCLTSAARHMVEQSYTWERTVAEYESLYRGLLPDDRSGAVAGR